MVDERQNPMFNIRVRGAEATITCRICGVQVTFGTRNTHYTWHLDHEDMRRRQPLDTDRASW